MTERAANFYKSCDYKVVQPCSRVEGIRHVDKKIPINHIVPVKVMNSGMIPRGRRLLIDYLPDETQKLHITCRTNVCRTMPLLAAARTGEVAGSAKHHRGISGAMTAVITSMATSGFLAAVAHLAPRLLSKRLRCCPPKRVEKNNIVVPACADDPVFASVLADAAVIAAKEPALRSSVRRDILRHKTLERALSSILGHKMEGCGGHSARAWIAIFDEVYASRLSYEGAKTPGELARLDLAAICDRDPACLGPAHSLLFFKGFQALQAHRLAHALWAVGRKSLALAMQAVVSERLGVDVHPAARLGGGLLIDHATGIVIGETCIVGEDCTIMQGVTLGASGKERGDRHPKIGRDVLVGAHAMILGTVVVGDGAKVGAGSVVLKPIPPGATAVGVPARVVGRAQEQSAGRTVDHALRLVDVFGQVRMSKGATDDDVGGGGRGRGKEEVVQLGGEGAVGGFKGKKATKGAHRNRPAWHDLWADVLDTGIHEKGFVSREELRERLAPFGCSESESDAVFWKLDANLDNKVDEEEFRERWEEAVVEVCPAKLCPEMRRRLGQSGRDGTMPELMSVKKKAEFFKRESERANEAKSGLYYVPVPDKSS